MVTIESITEEDDSVIKLLNNIILTAVSKKASDIHIEISNDALNIKYRIDGILHQIMEPLDSSFHSFLLTRLKVISELDIAEKRVPQDGRFRMKFKQKTIDFRVSIMPGIYGENAVIRILDREMITESIGELKLKQLGFSPYILEKINYYIRQPYGMFLVTGPTGSGKTTTLYAALNEIKDPADKIITIEDPVEYQVEGIMQIPVNEKKGLTFARGLRSILRHDPDKIMVGEIRDPETAQIAIQSALTGHLVFTTVHANNVFDVLGRFIHMGIDTYSFISALNCIAAQRLVRVLCPRCRKPVTLDKEALAYNRVEKGFFSRARLPGRGLRGMLGAGLFRAHGHRRNPRNDRRDQGNDPGQETDLGDQEDRHGARHDPHPQERPELRQGRRHLHRGTEPGDRQRMGLTSFFLPERLPRQLIYAGDRHAEVVRLQKDEIVGRTRVEGAALAENAEAAWAGIAAELRGEDTGIVFNAAPFIYNFFEFDKLPWQKKTLRRTGRLEAAEDIPGKHRGLRPPLFPPGREKGALHPGQESAPGKDRAAVRGKARAPDLYRQFHHGDPVPLAAGEIPPDFFLESDQSGCTLVFQRPALAHLHPQVQERLGGGHGRRDQQDRELRPQQLRHRPPPLLAHRAPGRSADAAMEERLAAADFPACGPAWERRRTSPPAHEKNRLQPGRGRKINRRRLRLARRAPAPGLAAARRPRRRQPGPPAREEPRRKKRQRPARARGWTR